ncbi:polyamine aminopropyltransferase [Saccharophagus degradans]|uniref:Polyamine aminopropyltransferase n=1 Tax=Saccharophagus degradans TaxID=86304 RepID=A0AAW7X7U7_9GAMM|nr:polyamine aminopropyltransferase [Saccharophagus degradans]MBU2984306.1 polyamine aminopropyltransferase [Saccharophagus degradans]MDO6422932.1 polyamine aminopropyltransferase [Saccharophagus degradans]MDO6607077.1 polyamine aminopropyltransferase [Saccharophagus degradans]
MKTPLTDINAKQAGVLLFSILIVALCGIVYELIIGTVSSYLLGNSVHQFSLTIGFFMFAMGVGSMISKYFDDQFVRNFIFVEIAIALVGGICSILLFIAFPMARALYELVMYSLILIIGALVGMEIPILTSLLAQKRSLKESIANVMSLDYVGALIGSVSFPLLLLPSLGLVQSSFAIGLINILVATINVIVFRHYLRHYHAMLLSCIGILVLLTGCIFYGTVLTRFAEKHLYFDQVIYSTQTPYQKLVVTRSTTTREQRLYIDGHIQFSSRDEYRYHEYLVHPVMSIPGPRKNVLILGGGDGLAAREVLKYDDVETIHLVDIDPEMLRIANELPMLRRLNKGSLDAEKLTAFSQDAFSFINEPGIDYDRVIIDMPDPHNEAINKLYSREFYTMIKRRMTPEGILVSQSSSPFFTRHVFWCIEQTLDHVFDNTLSYHTALPSFGIWGFNMARNNVEFPADIEFNIETRALTQAGMKAARNFDKDIAKVETTVNSIMEPKLYHLYIEDLRR